MKHFAPSALRRTISALTFLLLSLTLSACGGSSSSSGSSPNQNSGGDLPAMTGGGTAEAQTFFDQVITAADGEDIAFTVFVPENPNGQATPLVLHGHGFGLTRVKDFNDPNPIAGFTSREISVQIAKRIWLEKGFYVISFDQRGFGDSTGSISLMDPERDCRNISQIIDWAEANLPNLGFRDADPVLGGVGLSYGGGFQTVCSSTDTRFDAIAPLATWSHLPYSLDPNGTPKNIWLDILAVASQGNLEPEILQALVQATTTGDVDDAVLATLAGNSPRSFCLGEQGRSLSKADALFIQGSNDVLFNLNEAVENFECWKAQGRESHLIVQRTGHILPLLQEPGELILYGVDDTLYCGDQSFGFSDIVLDFLGSKLLGVASSNTLPEVCFSSAEQQSGLALSDVPKGGSTYAVTETQVFPGGVNSVVSLLSSLPLETLLTTLADLPLNVLDTLQLVLGGLSDPASLADYLDDIVALLPSELLRQLVAHPQFIPLTTLQQSGTLAGIPMATLNISGGNGDGNTLFFGLGRIPAGGSDAQLINDQVLPVSGTGIKAVELIGVSETVESGDTLGLIVYGFHPYYLNVAAVAQAPVPATVFGTVSVPFIPHSNP